MKGAYCGLLEYKHREKQIVNATNVGEISKNNLHSNKQKTASLMNRIITLIQYVT